MPFLGQGLPTKIAPSPGRKSDPHRFWATSLAFTSLMVISIVFAGPVQAALTITPNTWDIIGLDSNSPATGPKDFPVGVKVCSDVATTNVAVAFTWDSTNANINLLTGSPTSLTLPAIAANSCADAYFSVQVNPIAAAYNTTRAYHITATDGSGTVSTPTPRQLYVEYLISQNRNGVHELFLDDVLIPAGGAFNLLVGQEYKLAINGYTATQGYNQLESFINLPGTIFQILSVSTTYAADNSPVTIQVVLA